MTNNYYLNKANSDKITLIVNFLKLNTGISTDAASFTCNNQPVWQRCIWTDHQLLI